MDIRLRKRLTERNHGDQIRMATEIAKSTTSEDTESAPRLSLASTAGPRRFAWDYAAGIVAYHVVAALSFLPWFFSRTGVVLAILGLYVFGTLGINVCYHRLLAHRALDRKST